MAGMVITVGGKPGGGERYKPSESSDMEGEGDDAFKVGFAALASALESSDAVKGKKAVRLILAALKGEDEDEEEAPTSERM